jgi:hypothetical protein
VPPPLLQASHVKLEKLERAVAKLSSEVAAGVTMARKLEREKAGLKLARLDACEAYSVQKEELQAARTKLQVRRVAANPVWFFRGGDVCCCRLSSLTQM